MRLKSLKACDSTNHWQQWTVPGPLSTDGWGGPLMLNLDSQYADASDTDESARYNAESEVQNSEAGQWTSSDTDHSNDTANSAVCLGTTRQNVSPFKFSLGPCGSFGTLWWMVTAPQMPPPPPPPAPQAAQQVPLVGAPAAAENIISQGNQQARAHARALPMSTRTRTRAADAGAPPRRGTAGHQRPRAGERCRGLEGMAVPQARGARHAARGLYVTPDAQPHAWRCSWPHTASNVPLGGGPAGPYGGESSEEVQRVLSTADRTVRRCCACEQAQRQSLQPHRAPSRLGRSRRRRFRRRRRRRRRSRARLRRARTRSRTASRHPRRRPRRRRSCRRRSRRSWSSRRRRMLPRTADSEPDGAAGAVRN